MIGNGISGLRTLLTALVAAAALSGCVLVVPGGGAGRGDIGAVQIAPAKTSAAEARALSLVNAARREAGLSPVRYDPRLQAAAQSHSRWMARNRDLSHRGAGGTDMVARMRAAGYRACDANENVALGQPTAQRVVEGWVRSPGHSRNIRERGMRNGAVAGIRDGRGTIWWTMILAQPC